MNIHAIVTAYAAGMYGLSSPQLPGLLTGTDDLADYSTDHLAELLVEFGAPEEFHLFEHHQQYFSREDREWFVRAALDRRVDLRQARAASRELLTGILGVTPEPIDMAVKDVTGEALFVVTLLDDTVGWLSEQLEEGPATIFTRLDDDDFFTVSIHKHNGEVPNALPPEMTVRELWERLEDTAVPIEVPPIPAETTGQPMSLAHNREVVSV